MKAMIRRTYCPPEAMELIEVDKPLPREGEVLVRVHATSLNASDWEILTGSPLYGRIGGLLSPKHQILGSDVAGTVEVNNSSVVRLMISSPLRATVWSLVLARPRRRSRRGARAGVAQVEEPVDIGHRLLADRGGA